VIVFARWYNSVFRVYYNKDGSRFEIRHNKMGRVKPLTDEDIVHEYFGLIKTKDMYRFFADDAAINEPFSKSEAGKGGLKERVQ
jgi:hypothetical protein